FFLILLLPPELYPLSLHDALPIFEICGKQIIPVDVMHGNLQAFGYRIDDFAYLTDVKTISDEEADRLRGLKVLVVNALREEEHRSEEHTSELQSRENLVCRLLLEK